jgi:hypothetical protein
MYGRNVNRRSATGDAGREREDQGVDLKMSCSDIYEYFTGPYAAYLI